MKYVLLSILVLLSSGLLLAISFEADTQPKPELSHTDLITLKNELSKYNPFKPRRGVNRIRLTEKTVNQAIQLFFIKLIDIPVDIQLSNGYAVVSLSPVIPYIPSTLYANIRFSIFVKNKTLVIRDASIGRLPIPSSLIRVSIPIVEHYLQNKFPEYVALRKTIRSISLTPSGVTIVYRWNRNLVRQTQQLGKNLLFSPERQKLLAIYYKELEKYPQDYLHNVTSITPLIQFLFRFAEKRSNAGNDVVNEHKTVLLTLGIIASGVRIGHLLRENKKINNRHFSYGQFTLGGRSDLMRHFLISAALTASTNKVLSTTIGLSKEMDDADGGSGFSFSDLLADRAGITFAKRVLNIPCSKSLQEKIVKPSFTESQFMPSFEKLPKSVSKIEFRKKYGSVKDERYLKIELEIQKRIQQLPLYETNPTSQLTFVMHQINLNP